VTREEEAKAVLALHLDLAGETLSDIIAAMLAFADAEAAAMRERAAMCAEDTWAANHTPEQWKNPNALCDFIAANIRSLPATGEVGRG